MNEDQFNRVDAIMQQVVGKEGHRHSAETITVIFNLYNEVFNAREYSKGCGGCRERVYKRLKQWWYDNGGKLNR